MAGQKNKPTLDDLAKQLKTVGEKQEQQEKRQGNTERDVHHLQVESAAKKIVLDGLPGGICSYGRSLLFHDHSSATTLSAGEKTRVERNEMVTKFLADHYPELEVNVLDTVRLPGSKDKPGKIIVRLDSESAVSTILHHKKPRNPPGGRYVPSVATALLPPPITALAPFRNGVYVNPELSRLTQQKLYKKRTDSKAGKK